jgi:beta-barrel assembly-enhancing protease
MVYRALLLFLLALAPRALAEGLPDLGESAQSSFSALDEKRLGDEIIREIRADRSFYDDPEVTDYINAIGNRLVSRGADTRQPFEFFLINERSINAFALPGGYIGVHTGLLIAAQSESELASVLGHEIAHVTQRHIARMLAQQKQGAVLSLAALAVAILAARSSPDLATAATAFGTGAAVQSMINFTRDHEREADRVGLQILESAGYDPRASAVFFERLQRATRIYDIGGAPSYLRTHPMTFERIADIQNRLERLPYRQVSDSLDFQLVRAKIRAELDPPAQGRDFFETSLSEKRYLSEASSRYGLAATLVRLKDYPRARKEHDALRRVAGAHPMVDTLGCRIRSAGGDIEGAIGCYRDALRAHPQHRATTYEYAQLLLQARRPEPALAVISQRRQTLSDDPRLFLLEGEAYAMQGKRLAQHRSTGEAYARMGNVRGAIEQMQIALKSGDGDFYQMSAIEARLRELRKIDEAQRKEKSLLR